MYTYIKKNNNGTTEPKKHNIFFLSKMNTLSLPDNCDVEKPNMFMALAPERPASPICGSDNDSDDDRFQVV